MGWLTQKKVIIELSFYVSQPILYSPSCIIVVIGRQVEQHRGSISRYLYEIRCQVREVIISVPPRYPRYRLAPLRSLQLSESPPVSHYAQIVLGRHADSVREDPSELPFAQARFHGHVLNTDISPQSLAVPMARFRRLRLRLSASMLARRSRKNLSINSKHSSGVSASPIRSSRVMRPVSPMSATLTTRP